jgi:glutamine amidotransferase
MNVVIVDYGMGNIFSIQSAIKYLGVQALFSRNTEKILSAHRIILPGVGSFHQAMKNLNDSGIDEVIKLAAIEKQTPLLGICLGMELLGNSSTEGKFQEGLGLIDCPVERFYVESDSSTKIPHVGFNTITTKEDSILFQDLPKKVDVYFTHSYRMAYQEQSFVSSTCFHGEEFVASFEKKNIFGTQFHPEKSQSNGLVILKNFIDKGGY